MSKFTIEQQNEIIDMYKNYIDIENIISKFNTEEHYIREVLKENQIDRTYNQFSNELYQRIISKYLGSTKQYQIEYDLCVSGTGIRRIIDRAGIKRRGWSFSNQKYKRNSHYFDIIDTPNKAYILGLLYADSCNHVAHSAINITLQEGDKSVLDAIKKEIEYEGPIRFNPMHKKNPNYKNVYILCINDEYMSKQLENLGVVNAKSLKIKFPKFLNKELLSHFCRGYFDGDGNIYYYEKLHKCATQTVGTLDFCENLSKTLINIGIKNNIKHPKQCGSNTFILQTSGNKSSMQFLSWMYKEANIKMERKYKQYLDFCNKYQLAI